MTSPHTETILIDGRPVSLRLTLGALAEIEDALSAETLTDLVRLLANPSVRHILAILPILLRAAGARPEEILSGDPDVNLGDVMGAIAKLFRKLMEGSPPGKTLPAGSGGALG